MFQIIQRYYSTAVGKEKLFYKTIKKNHIVRAKSVAYIYRCKAAGGVQYGRAAKDSIYDISKAAEKRMYENKERHYHENNIDRR